MRVRLTLGVATLALLAAAQNAPSGGTPDAPTADPVVNAMLRLAHLTNRDVLYDLASGDGSIVVAAAKIYGARAVGVDIDAARVKQANENARNAGVDALANFVESDMFEADIHDATVVTLNLRIKPKLLKDLKPGTRVVSHEHDMGDWKPERTEKIGDETVYLWVVPSK
jgi:ribosomal protein L11 methylase PrmA